MVELFGLSTTATVIAIASGIVGLLLCLVICTCFCLFVFWRKNRKLEQEQDATNRHPAKQPLHNSSDTISRLSHKPGGSGHDIPGTTSRNGEHPASSGATPYSADETNSSDYNMAPGSMQSGGGSTGKWTGFDANFLVHPEQYLSASQGSNSGGKMAVPHTVTTSGSSNNRRRRVAEGHDHQSVSTQSTISAQNRMRDVQRHRLEQIVVNARNALQLIESRIISLECEIGRGKFGKVFRGLWTDGATKQQKTVAVKWFKQDEVDEAVFEDFVKEIAVAAHLPPHDNVLQIYGFCISPYALVTEYVNGGSVEMCVSTKHPRSSRSDLCIGDVVRMLIDAAKGISHLHTVNIIHRDVAARNLLIEEFVTPSNGRIDGDDDIQSVTVGMDRNRESANSHLNRASSSRHFRASSKRKKGNSSKRRSILDDDDDDAADRMNKEEIKWRRKRRVVVCDFGLSRITQNPDHDNHTNSHVGPLKWMAPESIRSQIYNRSTDVYSFGIVMWEVLCGTPPYPHTKVVSLAVEVIERNTRPCVLSWFPRPLQILMQRCWQQIASFRPSFEDIKNELQLFEQELIENGHFFHSIASMSANPEPAVLAQPAEAAASKSSASSSSSPSPPPSSSSSSSSSNGCYQTKEALRSLEHLVSDYLEEDRYHWDRLIAPKLKALIREHEEALIMDPSLLLAQINTMHNECHSELVVNSDFNLNQSPSPQVQPAMALTKNVSLRHTQNEDMNTKRMSRELSFTPIRLQSSNKTQSGTPGTVRFANSDPNHSSSPFPAIATHKGSMEESRRVLQLMANDSQSVKDPDVSVSIPAVHDGLQIEATNSMHIDMERGRVKELHSHSVTTPHSMAMATNYPLPHGHTIGDSVQIDIGLNHNNNTYSPSYGPL